MHRISWRQFGNEPLPQLKFTFFEWFYAIMRLIRDHLTKPWIENVIIGFITKTNAEKLLLSSKPDTFLLRFSDSILGQ